MSETKFSSSLHVKVKLKQAAEIIWRNFRRVALIFAYKRKYQAQIYTGKHGAYVCGGGWLDCARCFFFVLFFVNHVM